MTGYDAVNALSERLNKAAAGSARNHGLGDRTDHEAAIEDATAGLDLPPLELYTAEDLDALAAAARDEAGRRPKFAGPPPVDYDALSPQEKFLVAGGDARVDDEDLARRMKEYDEADAEESGEYPA